MRDGFLKFAPPIIGYTKARGVIHEKVETRFLDDTYINSIKLDGNSLYVRRLRSKPRLLQWLGSAW